MIKTGSLLLLISLVVPSGAYSLDLKNQTSKQCAYYFKDNELKGELSYIALGGLPGGYCVTPEGGVYANGNLGNFYVGSIGKAVVWPLPYPKRTVIQYEIEENKLVYYSCNTRMRDSLSCSNIAKRHVIDATSGPSRVLN